ncbi:HupE/UreJ family protein [Phenylobacterium sp. LjRoot225]|uniref:HupE/UreJ family protein n=1 Tax=Phenylobacterium sp. LjRoot225 TaxID=3342285 RepID=UPI003ECDC62A
MRRRSAHRVQWSWLGAGLLALAAFGLAPEALAHGVSENDKAFIQGATGVHVAPYVYLGAKHMVTGYDHLLFLVGVIFFLYRLKDVVHYVTLFAIGHSTTLLFGVLTGVHANPLVVDAIIGLSVVYKALDNLGGLKRVIGFDPNPKAAVLIFGFFHGFGLAAKLQELALSRDGLLPNLLSFNVGVEIGQFLALSGILVLMTLWRQTPSFGRSVVVANCALMCAGFVLIGYQLSGLFLERSA